MPAHLPFTRDTGAGLVLFSPLSRLDLSSSLRLGGGGGSVHFTIVRARLRPRDASATATTASELIEDVLGRRRALHSALVNHCYGEGLRALDGAWPDLTGVVHRDGERHHQMLKATTDGIRAELREFAQAQQHIRITELERIEEWRARTLAALDIPELAARKLSCFLQVRLVFQLDLR